MKTDVGTVIFILGAIRHAVAIAPYTNISSPTVSSPITPPQPTITQQATNTGEACAVSWIGWLESKVEFSFRTSKSVIFVQEPGLFTFISQEEPLPTPTFETIRSILVSSMPTQCDGRPRVTMTGQNEVTVTHSVTTKIDFIFTANSTYKEKWDLDDIIPGDIESSFWRKPTWKMPVCKIPDERCSEAWEGLKAAMRRFVPLASHLFEWSLKNPDIGAAIEMLAARKNASLSDNVLGHILIDEMFKDLNEHFMGGCVEPRIKLMSKCWNFFANSDISINTAGLAPEEALTKFGEDTGCVLKPDHGVLLYFPPKKAKATRDLCANGGWGDDPLPVTTYGPPETAIVTEVTIKAHEFYSSGGDHSSLWETYGHWKPESVMKGRWTMTAGNAYLAINTMMVYHACNYRPYTLYSDIMLTISTTDLSSLIAQQSPASKFPLSMSDLIQSRSFNLLDLDGPVPASAWQMSMSSFDSTFTITDGKYEPRISLPSALADYHPQFKKCVPFFLNPRIQMFGMEKNAYVWDPPVTLEGTPVHLTYQTPLPKASPPSLQIQPLPSMTSAAQIHTQEPGVSSTVIAVGTKSVTLDYSRIDSSGVMIGGNTLQVGGRPIVSQNVTLSLAPGNTLIVGGIVAVPIPAPTQVSVPPGAVPVDQPILTIQLIEGISIGVATVSGGKRGIAIGGSTTIGTGEAVTIGSKTLRFGTNGVLSDGGRPIATISITPTSGVSNAAGQEDQDSEDDGEQSAAIRLLTGGGKWLSIVITCFSYLLLKFI